MTGQNGIAILFILPPNESANPFAHTVTLLVDGMTTDVTATLKQEGRTLINGELALIMPVATMNNYYSFIASQLVVYNFSSPGVSMFSEASAAVTVSTAGLFAESAQNENGVAQFYWNAYGLPRGLSINSATGVISGIPLASGDFAITLVVQDQYGNEEEMEMSLHIDNLNSPLNIVYADIPDGKPGESYNAAFTANESASLIWEARGLPAGLSMNPSTDVIAGIPEKPGVDTVMIYVETAEGYYAYTNVSIAVTPEGLDDYSAVKADALALTWDVIKGENASPGEITEQLNLPVSGANGTIIQWSSDNPGVLFNSDGKCTVSRPANDAGDAIGAIHAFVQKGSAAEIVTFNLKVLKEDNIQGDAVCMNGNVGYPSLQAAIDASPDGGTATIRLLRNINITTPVKINNKNITFDLGSYNIELVYQGVRALEATNGGKLYLKGSGRFNVTVWRESIYVNGAGSEATVNNVTATLTNAGIGERAIAIYATNNGKVIVNGNVTASVWYGVGIMATNSGIVTVNGNVSGYEYGISTYNANVTVNGNITVAMDAYLGCAYGIYASNSSVTVTGNVGVKNMAGYSTAITADNSNVTIKGNVLSYAISALGIGAASGGRVTVDGDLETLGLGSRYIVIGSNTYSLSDQSSQTTKSYYKTYTDGKSFVWIYSYIPVAGIINVPSTVLIGKQLSLRGTVLPEGFIGTSIVWSLKDTGTTGATLVGNILTASSEGIIIVTAVVEDGLAQGVDYSVDYQIRAVTSKYVCSIGDTVYTTMQEALNTIKTGETAVIKMLQPFVHYTPVVIDNKTVIIDLNGFDVEVDTRAVNNSRALTVQNGGNLILQGRGSLNVYGASYGVYVRGACEVTVDNVTSTSTYSYGVFMDLGGLVTIRGNVHSNDGGVYVNGNNSELSSASLYVGGDVYGRDFGVSTSSGAVTITVKGQVSSDGLPVSVYSSDATIGSIRKFGPTGYAIYANGAYYSSKVHIFGDVIFDEGFTGSIVETTGNNYIEITISGVCNGNPDKYIYMAGRMFGKDDAEEVTTKPGYTTYVRYWPHHICLWIKNPSDTAFVPVSDITDAPFANVSGIYTAVDAGTPQNITGKVEPAHATKKNIEWQVKDAGATGAVIENGIFYAGTEGVVVITAVVPDGLSEGIPFTKDFTVAVRSGIQADLCEIVGTGERFSSIDAAISAVAAGDTATIKLLRSIYSSVPLVIDNKSITFELNCFDLVIHTIESSSVALTVRNGGKVYLAGEGEFNAIGRYRGVYVRGACDVTVSNAEGYDSSGVYVLDGGKITVLKNVSGQANASGENSRLRVNGDVEAFGTAAVYATYGANVFVAGRVLSTSRATASPYYAVYVSDENTSVTVGSAYRMVGSPCVYVRGGGKLLINGDCVVARTTSTGGAGISVWDNGELTINGRYIISYETISNNQNYKDYVYTPAHYTIAVSVNYFVPTQGGLKWYKISQKC